MASLTRRSVTSASWNALAQVVIVGIGFVRSVLLARLLNVETFGIYAGALAVVAFTAVVATMGMNSAFLYRSPWMEDEEKAASVYLTLQTIFSSIWAALMVAGAWLWADGPTRTALITITLTAAVEQQVVVSFSIHYRRVLHRRLALVSTLQIVISSFVIVLMAWQGFELWAILAGEIATTLVLVVGLYVWRPIWRPRWGWDVGVARYLVGFGLPAMGAAALESGLQRLDDIFVRYRIGITEMGLYSRAYTFASYPRGVIAAPVSLVAGGAYAEVAEDRTRLSRVFFRTLSFLLRTGFYAAALLVLVAPEFVLILLGEKWLPMVPILRLLSFFALLDPVRTSLGSLFVAVGKPGVLLRVRLAQLGVLLVGLITLGTRWGTMGVALAVNLMLLVGLAQMVWTARRYVDFSLRTMLLAPTLALTVGVLLALAPLLWSDWQPAAWLSGLTKGVLFTAGYGAVMLLMERREMMEIATLVRRQFLPGAK
jgi:O-antigen/teichoic acid export membrane protein